jgi:hypothetical protein
MDSMDTSLQLTVAMGPLESHGTPCRTLGPWASPYTQVLGHVEVHTYKFEVFWDMWMHPQVCVKCVYVLYIYICIYIYTYTYIYIYIYIFVYICVCMCVSVCVYIYIYT